MKKNTKQERWNNASRVYWKTVSGTSRTVYVTSSCDTMKNAEHSLKLNFSSYLPLSVRYSNSFVQNPHTWFAINILFCNPYTWFKLFHITGSKLIQTPQLLKNLVLEQEMFVGSQTVKGKCCHQIDRIKVCFKSIRSNWNEIQVYRNSWICKKIVESTDFDFDFFLSFYFF